MDIDLLDSKDFGQNLKRIRRSKKITQKQLAERLGKTERSIQNYEAGKTEVLLSTVKEIAIELDVDYRELLVVETADKKQEDAKENANSSLTLTNMGDIVNALFQIQECSDISMKLDISKPPEDKEWISRISVNGKGEGKYDMDFCLFLENWMQKLILLNNKQLSPEKYQAWKSDTIAYYASASLSNITSNEPNTDTK